MRFAWIVTAVGLAAGCQEYNISEGVPAYNGPNPPALENPENQDRILQVTQPSADVLWVVDNSGSMSDNQRALAQNFPKFMDYFLGSGLDYHIGVVTTDMDDNAHKGRLVQASSGDKWLTVDSADPMQMFASMAQVGIEGSGREQGRAATYSALELLKNGYNKNFLRQDAESGIHVVVISDENDASTNNQITIPEFIGWMNGLRPEDDLVTFNSIVNDSRNAVLFPPGRKYIDITQGVGGLWQALQDEDWMSILEDLGIQAAGLKREYFLSQLPVVDTLEVTVVKEDGTVLPPFERNDDYTYERSRNSIVFKSFLPEPLWEVNIKYTVLSSVVEQID